MPCGGILLCHPRQRQNQGLVRALGLNSGGKCPVLLTSLPVGVIECFGGGASLDGEGNAMPCCTHPQACLLPVGWPTALAEFTSLPIQLLLPQTV
jgi:hypothetical protein